jgi:hypothetical protein
MKTPEIESALVWGFEQKEIRQTFSKARPILDELPSKVDRGFLLYLLREQTWIALKWSTAERRKIENAWLLMCRAIDDFLQAAFKRASKELETELQNKRAAVEATGVTTRYWPEVKESKPSPEMIQALKTYSELFSLPAYEEALERKRGGRPTSYWFDCVALAMKEHLQEKTGSPQWTMVSRLLKCAPSIRGLSMTPTSIRQRLVKWQREERAEQRFKPTLRQQAYEFTRLYTNQKTPCPSLIHASVFRSPVRDSSLRAFDFKTD